MIEVAIPLLVFSLMFVIGANIDKTDIWQLKNQRKDIITVTLCQVILLPLLAGLIITAMQPTPLVTGGMLLVSLCPAGAVSNIYSLMAKSNVAFSVTLTAVNSLIAIIILPVMVLIIFPTLQANELTIKNLAIKQSLQLILLLLCPVLLGMLLRYLRPQTTIRLLPVFEKLSGGGLLVLLLAIFFQYHEKIREQLSSLILLALVFTVLTLLIAFCLGKLLKLKLSDRAVVMFELPVRNLALTAMIAVNFFGNSDYLLFAAVFFVIQTPIMFAVTVWYRSKLD